jgi:hypothetical protein
MGSSLFCEKRPLFTANRDQHLLAHFDLHNVRLCSRLWRLRFVKPRACKKNTVCEKTLTNKTLPSRTTHRIQLL